MRVVKSIDPFSAVTKAYIIRLDKAEESITDVELVEFCGDPRFGGSVERRRNRAGVLYAKVSLYMD